MQFDFKNDNPAVIHKGIVYSYKQLWQKITGYNKILSQQIQAGEVVVITGDYSFENIALFFSLYLNKNIIVPVTSEVQAEIEKKINIVNAGYQIALKGEKIETSFLQGRSQISHKYVKKLKAAGHSGLILFSSGSTSEPKAMIHDLDNLMDHYSNKREKNLIFLIFLLFDHIGGINTMLNIISMKACMVLPAQRKPLYIAELIEKYKINILPATPTFLNLLLISDAAKKYDLSSLKLITFGTEPMSDGLFKKIKEAFPRVKLLQTFGTSETGIVKTRSQSASKLLMKIDASDHDYKIVDGELWLKSTTRVLGYLNYTNNAFTEDGWFKTGDLAEITEDGYLKIIGRKSDIINVGGEKVLPSEIESALISLPEISDCKVYGEDNPITGQMVVADIVLKDKPREDLDEFKARLKFELRKTLEKYKIPRKINVVENLELTGSYKKKRG